MDTITLNLVLLLVVKQQLKKQVKMVLLARREKAKNKVYKVSETVGLQLTFNSATFVEPNEYTKTKKKCVRAYFQC